MVDRIKVIITCKKAYDPSGAELASSLFASSIPYSFEPIPIVHYGKSDSAHQLARFVVPADPPATIVGWLIQKGAQLFGKTVCIEISSSDQSIRVEARTAAEAEQLLAAATEQSRNLKKKPRKPRKGKDA